jgi:signal transduction histidine kinase
MNSQASRSVAPSTGRSRPSRWHPFLNGQASLKPSSTYTWLARLKGRSREWLDMPSTGLVATAAALGVAAGSASITLAHTSDHVHDPGISAALIDWITVPYVLAGLVAWVRRPDSRFGPLMVAAGFANFVTTLSWANVSVAVTIGQTFDLLPPVLFLHVFLAYPTGRLAGRVDRALVGLGYAVAIGLELVRSLLGEFGTRDLLGITSEPAAAEVVRKTQLLLIAALALAGIAVLAGRWKGASKALRRVLGPVVVPGALGLLMIALLFVSLAFSGPALVPIQRWTFLVLGAMPFAFLFGLLRSQLTIGPLVLALRSATSPGELRDALARALRDPSLQVLYWIDESRQYVTLDGRPDPVSDQGGLKAITTVENEGRRVAALVHDRSLTDEPELLEAVRAAAALALDNARLQTELRSSLHQLAASRTRIVQASDDERRRLERNLHDGAQQRLLALSVSLRLLESRAPKDRESMELMRAAKEQLEHSIEELRVLAHGLHPAVLSDHGLAVALEAVGARAPLPVQLSVTNERLPQHAEVAAYYLVSEALANVAKHADASSARVAITRDDHSVAVEVVDDGVGGADSARGSGLCGLADRVEALAGSLSIESPPGAGTRIQARIPLA